MRRLVIALLMLAAAGVQDAAAQSLFGTAGLGVPLTPLDARARGLGAIGVGLTGFNASLVNPAEIAGVPFRGVAAAFQPVQTEAEINTDVDAFAETIFPLGRIFYPVGQRLTLSAAYGSAFDQTWAVAQEGSVVLSGQTVETRDVVRSDGGLAQFRVEAGYELGDALALGVGLGVYTGELERTLSRTFPDSAAGLASFESRNVWEYGAPQAVAGFRWDPGSFLRVGGSVTWSGELDIDAVEGNAPDRVVDLPLQMALGASTVLAPRLTATLGARWSRWGDADGEEFDLGADDTFEIGAGLEWEGATLSDNRLPIRFGYHRGELPFSVAGGSPTENVVSVGAGLRLAETELGPLGVIDAALERGWRDADTEVGLAENFWRLTLSLALFGR